MEKAQLVDVLNHYSGTSAEEAQAILALRDEYPYSQVLQALSARVSKDHNFPQQQVLLQSAAVYSTDRTVLKEIMAEVYRAAQIKSSELPIAQNEKTSPSALETVTIAEDGIDYADEVLLDLKRLNELKLNFETMAEKVAGGIPVEPLPVKEKITRKPPGRPKKIQEAPTEPLIEAIKTTKKKIDPESPKTKEQIAIIDQFIKAQPTITSKPRTDVPASDLTDIKSGEFSDTIISETLAEILIRQGKKEKAIEVLRKLIWKFPQKKAYFAAQIEELKK